MHGLGNDFIILGLNGQKFLRHARKLAHFLCRRHFGIGADGLVFILPSDTGHFRMSIFNPDGTEAEVCGNALRCVAYYLYQKGIFTGKEIMIETMDGLKKAEMLSTGKGKAVIRVDMGVPRWRAADIPVDAQPEREIIGGALTAGEKSFKINCVSLGNPHCVIVVDDVAQVPLEEFGHEIENHAFFPERTNVEFIQVLDSRRIKVRVWERGVGKTLACGTGACASLAVCVRLSLVENRASVLLPGGELVVEWDRIGAHIYMEGSASLVYEGRVDLEEFLAVQ